MGEDRPRSRDHLVEPLFGALLPECGQAARERPRRRSLHLALWALAALAVGLALASAL